MNIQPYGTCIAIGMLCAGAVAFFLCKVDQTNWYDVLILASYMCGFGIMGAKALYLILNIRVIDWSRILEAGYVKMLLRGGFVFYGCFPGGVLGMLAAKKIHSLALEKPLRVFVASFPLAHAFGRVGCAMAGCCYGMPYNGPLAMHYHQSLFAPHNIGLFPVQLTETAALLVLMGVLLYLFFKKACCATLVYTYVIGYSLLRFCLEYLLGDKVRGGFLCFSTSQWISLILVIGMLGIRLFRCRRKMPETDGFEPKDT